METTVKQRLIIYLKEKGIGQKKFEISAGLSNGYINNLKSTPSVTMLPKILGACPDINKEWLLTGVGDMLVHDDNDEAPGTAKGSPYFDLNTIEGGVGIGDGTEAFCADMAAGNVVLPDMPIGSDIPYIKVHGRSMINHKNPEHSIPSGSLIALKPANFSSLSNIHWGEVYAFMTTSGPVVKKVIPSDTPGCIKCVSFNEEEQYYPYDQPIDEIIGGMYYVLGVVYAQRWK